MGLMSKLGKQWRKPTGWLGRVAVWTMNITHSSLAEWGLKHISIEKHWTILDVGCGGGATVHRLAEIAAEGRVYGVDFSEESFRVSHWTNKQLIQMDRVEIRYGIVSDLPFPEQMFDLVTAVNTHCYWPNLVDDMHEILRVLKPGGKLMLVAAAYKGGKYDARNQKREQALEVTYHRVDELGEIFSMVGYSNVQVFEEYEKGWICGIGEKPWTTSSPLDEQALWSLDQVSSGSAVAEP